MKYKNAEGRIIEATEHAYEVCYREMGFVPMEEKKISKEPEVEKEEIQDESAGEDVEESEDAPKGKRGRK